MLDVSPSPVAVTVTVLELGTALAEAVRVNVSLVELTAAAGVAGLADHVAVTPAGNPETENVMLPL